MKRKSW